jgi:DNA-binding CsgD family transcriptional regulator
VPNPGDDPLTSPRKVIAATVERRCVELRVKGKSYDAIAEELGIDPDTAMDAVERVLLRTRGKADELAEAARALEVRRCDAIIASFWERATDPAMVEVLVPADNESGVKKYDGQDKAADRLLKAMERRAKLLGLDASSGPLVSVQVLLASPDFRRIQEALVAALRPWPDAMRAAAEALRGIA